MYDINYYYNMLRMYSSTAEQICNIRWDFVQKIEPKYVLDYGSGCGFFKAFAPKGVVVDTYDIIQVPQTGITREHYDLITFWDVLEHEDWGNLERNHSLPMERLFDKADYIALSLPILPENKDFVTWKHRKPGEHQYYFSIDTLNRLFSIRGFKLVKSGYPECSIREDIYSALYGRTKYGKEDSAKSVITR